MPNATRTLVTALACAALMGAATAQSPTEAPDQTDALRGPSVSNPNDTGATNRLERRQRNSRSDAGPNDRQNNLPRFIQAVRALDRQGTDAELKLNEGQRAVIEVMLNEHTAAMDEWREANREELQEIKANAGQRRDQGAKRGRRGGQQGNRAQRGERRMDDQARGPGATERRQGKGKRHRNNLDENTAQELKALMQTRPGSEAQQAQIWDILTPAQRSFVESELERPRTKANRGQRTKRLDRPNGDDQARPRSQRQRPKRLEGETPEQFQQRMLERIEQLPAEKQEQALERLNRAVERMNQRDNTTSNNNI